MVIVYTLLSDGTYSVRSDVESDNTTTELAIPEYYNDIPVTKIEDLGFQNYTALESLTIPEQISYIGSGAFSNCTNLNSIYYNCVFNVSIGTSLGAGPFNNCGTSTSGITLYLGNSVTNIPNYLFYTVGTANNLTSIIGLERVKEVGESAFARVPLKSADLSSCITVGINAFVQCESLEYIKLGKDIYWIGTNAFNPISDNPIHTEIYIDLTKDEFYNNVTLGTNWQGSATLIFNDDIEAKLVKTHYYIEDNTTRYIKTYYKDSEGRVKRIRLHYIGG